MQLYYTISGCALFIAGITALAGILTGGNTVFAAIMGIAIVISSLSAAVGLFSGG